MTKSGRKHTPIATELRVLDRSRRRCALCFHVGGDLTEKLGQIAHLDDNPANSAEDNLAWLCLEHQSLFDSTTSQHKNYTPAEAKAARDRLYVAIESGTHFASAAVRSQGIAADRQTLADILALMAKVRPWFLRHPNFPGCSFSMHEIESFRAVLEHRSEPQYEFIDTELEELRRTFNTEGKVLSGLIASRLKPVPGQVAQYCIPIEFRDTDPDRFERMADVLEKQAAKTAAAYDALIRRARQKLEE
jgi:hypothetical protein